MESDFFQYRVSSSYDFSFFLFLFSSLFVSLSFFLLSHFLLFFFYIFLFLFFVRLCHHFPVYLSLRIVFRSRCILHKLTGARVVMKVHRITSKRADIYNRHENACSSHFFLFVLLYDIISLFNIFFLFAPFFLYIFVLSFSLRSFYVTTSRTDCHGGTVCNTYTLLLILLLLFFGTVY